MKGFQFILIFVFVTIKAFSNQPEAAKRNNKEPIAFIETLPPMQIDYSTKTMKTTLCFGSNRQCFSLIVNPSTYYTWVSDVSNAQRNTNKFDPSHSQTCKVLERHEIFFGSKKARGNEVEDSLSIDNFTLPKFRFYSLIESEELGDVEGMLGLGLLPDQENRRYSFMAQLGDKQFIQSSVFVVEVKGNSGMLTFGKVPNEILRDYHHYGNCRINSSIKMQKDSAWICNANLMTFGKEYNQANAVKFDNAIVKFDFTSEKTVVPIRYLLQLEKIYFEKAIESGDCNFGIKNGYYTYTCLTNDLPLFQEISFVFEDWLIHIPFEHLFVHDPADNEFEFIIYNKDSLDEFVIGMNIMKHYRMVFDESKLTVGFYNGDSRFVAYIGQGALNPPQIPDDNGLQPPNPSDKDRPLQPPKDPVNNKPVPIPEQQRGFFIKFFMFIGIFSLIMGVLFISWLAFRYYRRKRYNDPSFYYKATDDIFQDGTRIE